MESFQEAKIGVESDFGRGCVGSFLGVCFLNRLGYGERFHLEELGVQCPSGHPQPLCAFMGGGFWCEQLGGVRVGWSGPWAFGACPSGQDGALQTPSAWQMSLPMSADLREREVWGKHGIF